MSSRLPLQARGLQPTVRSASPRSGSWRTPRHDSGFTLVELLIVVVILGILAAVVIPTLGDVSTDATLNAAQKEFEIMEVAFRSYYTLHDEWPGDQNQGIVPPEIEDWLSAGAFLRKPIIGQHWDWNPDFGPVDLQPNIAVHDSNPDLDLWLKLDQRFDDGDLSTGGLRYFGGRSLCYGVSP